MKITKYRYIVGIYPRLFMEAEVQDEDQKFYVNFEVNDTHEPESENITEDDHWAYNRPFDEIMSYETMDEFIVDKNYSEIVKQMVAFWNSNPIWPVKNPTWKSEWFEWPK